MQSWNSSAKSEASPHRPARIMTVRQVVRVRFCGQSEEIAERIVELHKHIGHMRQFLQMDVGQMQHKAFLRSIELLGTKVKPLVDAELGSGK